jgi:hypothetical protein
MAYACPVVPQTNVVCAYASATGGAVSATADAVVTAIVDLRSAPLWCVSTTLNTVLTADGGTGKAEYAAAIYADGTQESGDQVGHQQVSTVHDGDVGSISVTGVTTLRRGIHALAGYASGAAGSGATSDLYLSVQAIPSYAPGAF